MRYLASLPGIIAALALTIAAGTTQGAPPKTLKAFANEQEISELFKRWAQGAKARRDAMPPAQPSTQTFDMASPSPAAPATKSAEAIAESLTNVQHAGVDEGGIVKRHGDHLVILRRGRLFAVRIGGNDLTPISIADAFGHGIDPRGAWYDELLIYDDTIIVIGYSYARGGTEIGLFDITRDGRLGHRATWHLRSNDYYSSRNYASRLVGNKLVFYTPLRLNPWGGDPWASFPALRRWQPGATPDEFRRIAPATRIYRTDEPLDPWQGVALHTVTVCDLATADLTCESTAVMGAPGRVFYVSGGSVYVWTTPALPVRHPWPREHASALFRIPLDGAAPTALKVTGSPIDQFSFLEDNDEHLNVLVRAGGRGESMWSAEANAGDYALLRVALSRFSDGRESAPASSYRPLPHPRGHAIQNRFIGAYLLYGSGAGWRHPRFPHDTQLHALRYANDTRAQSITLPHGIDRIEALGGNAVVIGSDGRDLHFTSLRLARSAGVRGHYVRPDAAQGETRSHGFFYRAATDDSGYVGLPIVRGHTPASRHLRHESAAVLFLRNASLRLAELGALESQAEPGMNDGCRASCVDWYGNSRPLFIGDRVFALMGYEIVEGVIDAERIRELRRVRFSPLVIGWAR